MAATHALGPLELSETEQQRLVRGEALGMGVQTRVQDQTTSLEQVEESREVAKDLQLDQEREVLKNQEPLQGNQEVEEGVSKVEAVGSKVEATESKEEVEVKQVPARERNCRYVSFLMSTQAAHGWILAQLKCSGLHRRLPGFQCAGLWRVRGRMCEALR